MRLSHSRAGLSPVAKRARVEAYDGDGVPAIKSIFVQAPSVEPLSSSQFDRDCELLVEVASQNAAASQSSDSSLLSPRGLDSTQDVEMAVSHSASASANGAVQLKAGVLDDAGAHGLVPGVAIASNELAEDVVSSPFTAMERPTMGRLCDHTFAGPNGFTYVGVRYVPGPYRHRKRRAAARAGAGREGGLTADAGMEDGSGGEGGEQLRLSVGSRSGGANVDDGGSSDSDVPATSGHWEAVVHVDVTSVHGILLDAACAGVIQSAPPVCDAPRDGGSALDYVSHAVDVHRHVAGPFVTAVEAAWAHDELVRAWFGDAALVNFGADDSGVEGVVVTL